jgi:hypothetical protein
MRQLELSAHAGGQHVSEDLAKVQLSELYPLAHFVVGVRNSASQWVVWPDFYGDWPRP